MRRGLSREVYRVSFQTQGGAVRRTEKELGGKLETKYRKCVHGGEQNVVWKEMS